jgi:thiamine-phosphate pyrophosphorylase
VTEHSARIRGFYAVLDRDDPAWADLLLAARPCALQIRMKSASASEVLAAARRVRDAVHRAGALLIINDRVDLALVSGADGVHLGQTDLPLAAARQIAPGLLIGVSTHDEDQVRAAVAAGADYLGYGPVFPTRTKDNPDPVQGIQALARACALANLTPVVAIGGIAPANVTAVAAAGAAAACAISAVDGTVAALAVGKPWHA